ncbi:MAG TPA: thiamine pyrophosphate-dependent enzyme [bacterium]|nr:thiamine pyrophosphate-dependent enzyme [bacterium]
MLAKVAMFEMLRARGVRYVFGNPGTTELNFMEMFADYPDVRYVLALQDAIPVGIAYGYAQATGQPAFVNLHITPGLANGLGNIFNAYRAKVPMVVTAGQVDTRMILQEPSLWSDLARLAAPYTKWSYEARAPEDVPQALARAFKTAAAPPAGPVFLGLPMNCLDGEVPGTAPWFEVEPDSLPSPTVLDRIAASLADARDPVLIVGGGAATARARTALVRLAESTGARVYGERLPTRSAFPTDHPQYLGMAGLALPELQAEIGAADAVVLAGARKFAGLLYTPPANLAARTTVIHIDPDPWELGKNLVPTIGAVGDVGATLAEVADRLAVRLGGNGYSVGAEQRRRAVAKERAQREERWRQAAALPTPGERMSAACAYRILGEAMTDATTIVDEAVTAARIVDRYLPLRTERSYFGLAAGSLGLGLPAALGAQLAWPDRRVVCTIGDGSLMYTVQALWTAARYHIPVTVFVVDNRAYEVLKSGMRSYKGASVRPERLVGMDLDEPAIDIPAVARGFGVEARVVSEPAELREALAEPAADPRLLDVLVREGI